MRKFFILILSFSTLACFSQSEESTVRFYVKGSSDYFIRIDGELMPKSNIQKIAPGSHKIEIWSPKYKTYSGTINIPEQELVTYYRELEVDDDYKSYLAASEAYKKKIFIGRTAPLFLAGVGAIASPLLYFSRKNAHEDLVLQDFKSKYFADQKAAREMTTRYQTTNALFFTSAGLLVGGIVTHLLLRNKVNSLKKPVYEQKNPFTLETFTISYSPVNQSPTAGFTLNF